jgi:hypothetical protein
MAEFWGNKQEEGVTLRSVDHVQKILDPLVAVWLTGL